jgi:hypothetical protein
MLPKLALSLILVQTFLRPAVAQTSTASAAATPAPSASQESWQYVAKRLEAASPAAYTTPSAGAVSVAEDHRYAATAARTGALAEYLSHEDVRLTYDQKARIGTALSSADAIHRSATQDSESVHQLRQAERDIVLTYWDSDAPPGEKAGALAPQQVGYVFERRFADILERFRSAPRIQETAKIGVDNAQALSHLTDIPPSPALQRLLVSFDGLSAASAQATARLATLDGQLALVRNIADVNQQVAFYDANHQALVKVTVKTVDPENRELFGYRIRYELISDVELGTPANTSFDEVTRATGQLGPYHYMLWAEKAGTSASTPMSFNLGVPLLASREIEIPVSPP